MDNYKDELSHVGVLGMKWGHRKSGDKSGGSGGSAKVKKTLDEKYIKINKGKLKTAAKLAAGVLAVVGTVKLSTLLVDRAFNKYMGKVSPDEFVRILKYTKSKNMSPNETKMVLKYAKGIYK